MQNPPVEYPKEPPYLQDVVHTCEPPYNWENDNFLSTTTDAQVFMERNAYQLIGGGIASLVVGISTIRSLPQDPTFIEWLVTDVPNLGFTIGGSVAVMLGAVAFIERRHRATSESRTGQQGSDPVE